MKPDGAMVSVGANSILSRCGPCRQELSLHAEKGLHVRTESLASSKQLFGNLIEFALVCHARSALPPPQCNEPLFARGHQCTADSAMENLVPSIKSGLCEGQGVTNTFRLRDAASRSARHNSITCPAVRP